ncbi:MAG: gamma-glutamyltransferase family protein [Acidiferrobacterales bacterium]
MLQTPRATRGAVVAPHHLAAQAGLRVLREGGNAIEAIVAAAATIVVVYPHMNSLGGDNFWLIRDGAHTPVGIDACGGAAAAANVEFYRGRGLTKIPERGPLAANTVAGAVAGWQAALDVSRRWAGQLPLARLLEDAQYYAREGMPVTLSQHNNTVAKQAELEDVPGFAATFLPNEQPPAAGSLFKQPALAETLKALANHELDDFYRGALAHMIAADLERVGSPLRREDLACYHAREVTPLSVQLKVGTVYNLPPPTQGLASLIVLALFERLQCPQGDRFDYVHLLVEASKCAFRVRDQHVTDPAYMDVTPERFLSNHALDDMLATIDRKRAAAWDSGPATGDTVWLGAIDGQGRAVSFIQSVYWEFGSGVVLPDTGITWQNRGTSFTLEENALNILQPGRKPFHTIQPAMALLDDGRLMVYGTMGGEGQPQTQAAIYTRYVTYGQALQTAITAPRWLLGRTWGTPKTNLRLENRFDASVVAALKRAGHDVELVAPFDEVMGHAGALVHHPGGLIEGAADPRGDGVVAAF